jgi:hypothetical protein
VISASWPSAIKKSPLFVRLKNCRNGYGTVEQNDTHRQEFTRGDGYRRTAPQPILEEIGFCRFGRSRRIWTFVGGYAIQRGPMRRLIVAR